ncbi:polyphosphate kinase 1 [Myxococcota bacterium]|nr:polyphosphate kinase 1 [Myxococcota bacterium]
MSEPGALSSLPKPRVEPGSRGSAPAAPAGTSALFVNRELSFLEFNQRIVEEAADPTVPLLERLKFAAIVSSNLDEFYMVRVAGLKQQLKSGVMDAGPDGMLPSEQLAAIAQRTAAQLAEQERVFLTELLPSLSAQGVHVLPVAKLSEGELAQLRARFSRQLFPILTPLAIDPGHPVPFIKNRTINLAVHLLPESSEPDAYPLLAVVQVPAILPRFINVDHPGDLAVVLLEDVIASHVGTLFPGMRILECVPFRVIRNWDLSFDEDEQEDLLDTVQKELRRRWKLDAVLLEIGADASSELVARLQGMVELGAADTQRHRAPLALADFSKLLDRVGRSDLRDEAFSPVLSVELQSSEDMFAHIARGDVLLHHPYESYEPVVDLLEQAAAHPAVLAIKQTLYRVNRKSPIVEALIRAAQNGKQVTALVELKARFDEEVNVEWARALEEAGVHVVYGLIGLKTHCKVTLVVRREPVGIRRYVHLGTGNYNEETATIYSDLSYFTAREDVANDIASLFNLLTGYSEPPAWQKLVVAPIGLRKRVLELIERERQIAKKGGNATIIFKSNALVDPQTIRALCKASQSGVKVHLLIRGPSALRVGVPGVSDKISVRFVVDRFLEHSRIFYFAHDGAEDVFITSTDIMPRNFDRRIEVMLPIEDERLKRRIIDEVLAVELADNTKAAVLEPDGAFRRLRPKSDKPVRAQQVFIDLARKRAGAGKKKKDRLKDKGRKSKDPI